MPSKPWTINEFLVFFLRKWLNFWDEKSWPIFKELELVYHGRTNRWIFKELKWFRKLTNETYFTWFLPFVFMQWIAWIFLPRFKLWVRLESRNKLKRLTRANIYLRVIAAISSYQNSLVVITWILAKIIKNELWALARGILDFYSWFTGILGLLGKILELHETRLCSTT